MTTGASGGGSASVRTSSTEWAQAMGPGVRLKLVLLSVAVLVVASFGFTRAGRSA